MEVDDVIADDIPITEEFCDLLAAKISNDANGLRSGTAGKYQRDDRAAAVSALDVDDVCIILLREYPCSAYRVVHVAEGARREYPKVSVSGKKCVEVMTVHFWLFPAHSIPHNDRLSRRSALNEAR